MGGSASKVSVCGNPKEEPSGLYLDHPRSRGLASQISSKHHGSSEKRLAPKPSGRHRRSNKKTRYGRAKTSKQSTKLVASSGAHGDDDAHKESPELDRDHGKLESLMRDGVMNISKAFRDWSPIQKRGSKSTVAVGDAEARRALSPITSSQRQVVTNNLFNFHHETYLAQSRHDNKRPTVEAPLPKHLSCLSKLKVNDGVSSRNWEGVRNSFHQNSSLRVNLSSEMRSIPHGTSGIRLSSTDKRGSWNVQHTRQSSSEVKQVLSKHRSPESTNRLKPRRGGRKTNNFREKKGSNAHIFDKFGEKTVHSDNSSSTYVYNAQNYSSTKMARHHSATLSKIKKNDGDNARTHSNLLSPKVSRKSPHVGTELFPRYKRCESKQDKVEKQGQDVQPTLSLLMLKSKVIRVNGVEYVRKKSEHPLLKKLLGNDSEPHRNLNKLKEKSEKCILKKETPKEIVSKEGHIYILSKENNSGQGDKRQEKSKNVEEKSEMEAFHNRDADKKAADLSLVTMTKTPRKSKEAKNENRSKEETSDPKETQPSEATSSHQLYLPPMKYMPTPIIAMHQTTSPGSSAVGERRLRRKPRFKRHPSNKTQCSDDSTALAKGDASTTPKQWSRESFDLRHFVQRLRGRLSKPSSVDSGGRKHNVSVTSSSAMVVQTSASPDLSDYKIQAKTISHSDLKSEAEQPTLEHVTEENASPGINASPKMVVDCTEKDKNVSPPTGKQEKPLSEVVLPVSNSKKSLASTQDAPHTRHSNTPTVLQDPNSQNSLKKWCSRSVRSKHKVFENMINIPPSCMKPSRKLVADTQAPQAQGGTYNKGSYADPEIESSTPTSPARPVNGKSGGPAVYTPWDSCMMFKNGRPTRRQSLPIALIRRKPRSARSRSPSKTEPACLWEKKSPNQICSELPIPIRNSQPKGPVPLKIDDYKTSIPTSFAETSNASYRLEDCKCSRVETNHPRLVRTKRQPLPAMQVTSKLDRVVVENFERQFKNSHLYRTMTGNLSRPAPTDPARSWDKRRSATSDGSSLCEGKRCSNCGRKLGDPRARDRCVDCGEVVDGRHECDKSRAANHKICVLCGRRFPENEDNTESSPESCFSAQSGKVPPYRKVLRMFEKKSRDHATSSSRQWQPRSSHLNCSGRDFVKPASHFNQYKQKSCREHSRCDRAVESYSGRIKEAMTERRRRSRYDASEEDDAETSDPHFNRSEKELFRNARTQWESRDQRRGGGRQSATPSPRVGSVGRAGKTPGAEDARRHW